MIHPRRWQISRHSVHNIFLPGVAGLSSGNGSTTPTSTLARGYDDWSSSCWRRRRRRRCVCGGCCTGRTSGGLVGAAKISCWWGRSMNTRYTHTARGRLVRETRAASPTVERREKKSINNTDYWFWHRRWRGGRHCTVDRSRSSRTLYTPSTRRRRHHVTYKRFSPSPNHSGTDQGGGAFRWQGELIAEKPNLLGKSAENIIRRPWRCNVYRYIAAGIM